MSKLAIFKGISYIGMMGSPSGYGWKDTIVDQKKIKRDLTKNNKCDTITLVYFENGFCCNVNTVKFEEENNNE